MHEFRDPTALTRVAVIAVLGYMGIELLLGVMTVLELASPSTEVSTRLFVYLGVALLTTVAVIACIVIVGMWIYRVSANAHTLSDEMTISPGWAVGWYFVPIMNLFRPFQGMKEAWMASHYRGNWHGEPTPALLIWWWTLWIGTNMLGYASFRLSFESPSETLNPAAAAIDIVVAIANVPLCLILVTLMRRLCRAQLSARYDEAFA